MHLERLRIRDFRSCEDVTVHFHEDLTILAGENNAGKTNIVDALRLVTSPIDGRRSRYADPDDIRRSAHPPGFTIEAFYSALDPDQRGVFITAIDDLSSGTATYGFRYTAPAPGARRGSSTFWAGTREGGDPEPEARERIRHVHLQALRDAQRDLASGSPGRIAFLLSHLSDPDAPHDALITAAKTAYDSVQPDPLITRVQDRIDVGLNDLTTGVQRQVAKLRFEDPTLQSLARDLRFHLAREGFEPAELSESGLGYANLLYFAAVLVELQASREADLTLFLVEEPEAHLHPQLQATTLKFLQRKAEESKVRDENAKGQPAGRIQVIVTTHSPHLTSSVSSKTVVLLRSTMPTLGDATASSEVDRTPAPPVNSPVTAAIAVSKLGLSASVIAKIDRYLDVTRSALLFSRRVLLLEGLAEALLLPIFAQIVLKGDSRRLSRFHATTLVAIDGVDFEPYVRLLLSDHNSHRLADRVVVLTDEDPGSDNGQRVGRLSVVAEELGASESLHGFTTPFTFEAELFASGNVDILKEAFLSLHPRSEHRWRDDVAAKSPSDQPRALLQLMLDTGVGKGDYAQRIAEAINNGAQFVVPPNIETAIKAVVA
jgi:putative ATP-dependent endonuclease of the OLD family